MKQFTRSLVTEFTSAKNKALIRGLIEKRAGRCRQPPDFAQFFASFFDARVDTWGSTVIAQEFGMSDPMPGITVGEHVSSFNAQFVDDVFNTIPAPPPDIEQHEPGYTRHLGGCAASTLDSWRHDISRRREVARDDQLGDGRIYAREVSATYSGVTELDTSYDAQCDDDLARGVYDYSAIARFETPTMKKLNQCEPYLRKPIGYASPEGDARLMSRRIFRSNEAGVENGIPRYEQRLYRRHYDADASETFVADSRGAQPSGYDMGPLYDRRDAIKSWKSGR